MSGALRSCQLQVEEEEEEDLPEADSEPEEELDEVKQKKRALEEKDKGNAAYKAKRFDEAIGHYDAAYQLFDQDISFLTNRSASGAGNQSDSVLAVTLQICLYSAPCRMHIEFQAGLQHGGLHQGWPQLLLPSWQALSLELARLQLHCQHIEHLMPDPQHPQTASSPLHGPGCRAAVHFEKGDYGACVADCDKAVERGRELRADYKLVKAASQALSGQAPPAWQHGQSAAHGCQPASHISARARVSQMTEIRTKHIPMPILSPCKIKPCLVLQVGRALTRKGTSLVRLNRLEEAVNVYHKALTEHRWGSAQLPLWPAMRVLTLTWTCCCLLCGHARLGCC